MNSEYRGDVSLSEVAKVVSADGGVSSAGAVSLDIHRELPSSRHLQENRPALLRSSGGESIPLIQMIDGEFSLIMRLQSCAQIGTLPYYS